jgi:hypothetical protein
VPPLPGPSISLSRLPPTSTPVSRRISWMARCILQRTPQSDFAVEPLGTARLQTRNRPFAVPDSQFGATLRARERTGPTGWTPERAASTSSSHPNCCHRAGSFLRTPASSCRSAVRTSFETRRSRLNNPARCGGCRLRVPVKAGRGLVQVLRLRHQHEEEAMDTDIPIRH